MSTTHAPGRVPAVDEVKVAEAARLFGRSAPTVRKMWRVGQIGGRMQRNIAGQPFRLLISTASIRRVLADEARSPLDIARRGLPTGIGDTPTTTRKDT